MQAKGAVHWEEQRADYQTMEEQAYMGEASTIRGIRRFAGPQRRADQRAALQQLAAATQGKGNAPWVPRRRGLNALLRDVSAERLALTVSLTASTIIPWRTSAPATLLPRASDADASQTCPSSPPPLRPIC